MWVVRTVLADEDAAVPGFAYTAGLVTYGHPEFVVFGLGARHARQVLNELAERVRDGSRFADGDAVRASTISPPDLRLVDILVPPQAARGAEYALQVVYADFRGAFPWDPNYCYPSWLQRIPQALVA